MAEQDKKDMSNKENVVDTGRKIDVSNYKPKVFVRQQNKEKQNTKNESQDLKVEEKTFAQSLKEENTKEKVSDPIVQNENSVNTAKKYREPLTIEGEEDFCMLLEEQDNLQGISSVNIGDKVSGTVIHITDENIFLSLGQKLEASIAKEELLDKAGNLTVKIGDKVSAFVLSFKGGIILSNDSAQSGLDISSLEEARANKTPVQGKVASVVNGGLEITISGKKAFCPISQIDDSFVEDASSFVGKVLNFQIEKIENSGRNIVVSRKKLLEEQKRDEAKRFTNDLAIGKIYDAQIDRVQDFGAFVSVGGLTGLIPRKELSYGYFEKTTDIVSTGDKVKVIVLDFAIDEHDILKSKITLSLKQTLEDPFVTNFDKITPESVLEGKVVRLEPYGAFVELFPGIDGLIHISELSDKKILHPKEVINAGDPVSVVVLDVNKAEKKVSLGLREVVLKREKASAHGLARGDLIKGVVSRIEKYGLFLEIMSKDGVTALLPSSETGQPKLADLGKIYPIGTELEVLVIDIDDNNRVKVSLIAKAKKEERDSFNDFKQRSSMSRGLGTLADLFKKK